jgi:hypothetical protein
MLTLHGYLVMLHIYSMRIEITTVKAVRGAYMGNSHSSSFRFEAMISLLLPSVCVWRDIMMWV